MKTLLVVLMLVAQTDPRIDEGIRLHDARKYDEAIARYKAVLADQPDNALARYEMAFSYYAKGDAAGCKAAIEPIVDQPNGKLQPLILTTYANCLDILGESRKAIAVYRKGLEKTPDEPQLLYNLAVTLLGQNQPAEARELLKKELALQPLHPAGHFALAKAFEAEGFRGPAILSYLRVLAVDLQPPRRQEAAQRVAALLNAGVEQKKKGEINVTIDPEPRKEEGDFSGWEMMMSLASAARFSEENEKLSEFERARTALALSLRMLIESPPKGSAYSIERNVPFFIKMEKEKLLDLFAGIAVAPLGLDGAEAWLKQNEEAIGDFAMWSQRTP